MADDTKAVRTPKLIAHLVDLEDAVEAQIAAQDAYTKAQAIADDRLKALEAATANVAQRQAEIHGKIASIIPAATNPRVRQS